MSVLVRGLILFVLLIVFQPVADAANIRQIALVVHGGAGTITRASMTAEREAEYRTKLEEGLLAGYRILADGGSSLDAV
jgi:beta-aspartyl-peptidase (threonine type)